MKEPTARVLTVPGCPHVLEARERRREGAGIALVAPPHPLYGGSIGNPVVRAIEHAFSQRGLGTLAFNFRGTGESTGEPSGSLDDALVDYLAAAQSVADENLAWLSGYSFGSIAALAAATSLSVPRVLMVAPPLALLDPALLAGFSGTIAVAVGSDDEYAPLDALRATFAAHPRTTVEIVDGTEHFFLGSGVQRLAAALTRLLDVLDEA